jgi:hypothetical protein
LLERRIGRSAEPQKRCRVEFGRESFDHPRAPAIERVVDAIASLGARSERAPSLVFGHASENDRTNVRERAAPFAILKPHRPRGTRPLSSAALKIRANGLIS